MRTRTFNPASRRPSRLRSLSWPLAWVAAILALAGLAMPPAASAGPSTTPPPTVSIALSTLNTNLGGAIPTVLAKAGDPITLVLTTSATFNQNVTFNLNVSLTSGAKPTGLVSPTQVTLPANTLSVTINDLTYSGVDNGVTITPSVSKNKPSITAVPSNSFDSLRTLNRYQNPGPNQSVTLGSDTCTQTTVETNCGVAVLPQSFASSEAALSTGATGVCTSGQQCKQGSTVVQFIADVGTIYSDASPATLIIRCDKTQCGNGGVTKFNVYYTYNSSGPLDTVAPACLNKGQANPGGVACVDYVNSSRDNAGDLLLWLNFTHDIRSTGY